MSLLLDEILVTIEHVPEFVRWSNEFVQSRTKLIEQCINDNNISELTNLLKEDVDNIAQLKVALQKTGQCLSNLKKIEQYLGV